MLSLCVALLLCLSAPALSSAATVNVTGYIVDRWCFDMPGHKGIDGALLGTAPGTHNLYCLLIPQCIPDGFVVLEELANAAEDGSTYGIKYTLDDVGDALVLLLAKKEQDRGGDREFDEQWTVTGDLVGNEIQVTSLCLTPTHKNPNKVTICSYASDVDDATTDDEKDPSGDTPGLVGEILEMRVIVAAAQEQQEGTAAGAAKVAVVTHAGTSPRWIAFGLTNPSTGHGMNGARAVLFQPDKLEGDDCSAAVGLLVDMSTDASVMRGKAASPSAVRGVVACSSGGVKGSSFTFELSPEMFLLGTEDESSPFFLPSLLLETDPAYVASEVEITMAYGSDATFGYHAERGKFVVTDLANPTGGALNDKAVCTDEGRTGPVAAHGALMAASWGILIPLGVLCARFLKGKRPWWFKFHRTCQSLGLLLALIGWIVALKNFTLLDEIVDGKAQGRSSAERAHAVMGCVVMVVGLLQPLNAFVRPHPSSDGEAPNPLRRVWELVHKGSGRGATLLGIVNVIIGIDLAKNRDGCAWIDVVMGCVVSCVTTCILAAVYLSIWPLDDIEKDPSASSPESDPMRGKQSEDQASSPSAVELGSATNFKVAAA